MNVSWSAAAALPAPAGSIGYAVERAPAGTTTWSPACASSAVSPVSDTSCTDAGLIASTAYQYRVTSVFQGWRAISATSAAVTTASSLALNTVTPNARPVGTTTTVTLQGSGFLQGATVTVSGTGVTSSPTSGSGSTLSATFTIASGAPLGARTVTVTNPGGATATCSGCFTVQGALSITSVSPSSFPSKSTRTVVIAGTGFAPGATVTIGGPNVTWSVTSVTSTAVTVSVTSGSNGNNDGNLAPRDVTVTNPDGAFVTRTGGLSFT